MPTIQQTLGNESWVQANLPALRNMFPATPTKIDLGVFLSVGFKIKVLGVEWRDENDLPKIMSFLQKLKIIDIKTFEGETYVAPHISAANKAAYLSHITAQDSARQINRTEPPPAVKALAASYLDKIKKG